MNDILFSVRTPDHRFRLKDGSICRIRAIGHGDRHLLQAGFARLSPQSRRLRFFNAKQSLTDGELDFLTSADGRNHIALGAVRLDARGNEVEGLGTARCIRFAPKSDTAELAITVVDDMQGQGIGGTLLSHLVTAARRQGIRRFQCEVLAENEAMRAVAKGLDSDPRWLGDGIVEYECALPETDPHEEPPRLSDSPDSLSPHPFSFSGWSLKDIWTPANRSAESIIDFYAWPARSWLNYWTGAISSSAVRGC